MTAQTATPSTVTLTIDGHAVEAARGTSLLNAILNAGLLVATACGGKGSCQLCRVHLLQGAPGTPAANPLERRALGNVLLQEGMRLACQLPVEAGMDVKLPLIESPAARRARMQKARAQKKGPR